VQDNLRTAGAVSPKKRSVQAPCHKKEVRLILELIGLVSGSDPGSALRLACVPSRVRSSSEPALAL
jgi:hypothetical protein